jgi:hypothetical protein
MGFLDKAKQAAEQAAAKAKEGVEDVQQKRELSQAYNDLGKTTFELIEAGEISHPRFEATTEKIRALNEKIAEVPVGATASTNGEGFDSSQPPAMPN